MSAVAAFFTFKFDIFVMEGFSVPFRRFSTLKVDGRKSCIEGYTVLLTSKLLLGKCSEKFGHLEFGHQFLDFSRICS